MKNDIAKIKQASRPLSLLSESQKNAVLRDLASALRAHAGAIIAENAKDLAQMDSNHPMCDRLLLNESRIFSMADDIEHIIDQPDPIGKILESKVMPNGLRINKIRVPLGVVAVIYESRPNVTVDVFSLCFKSGNACILKGGKEASHSNAILLAIIQDALIKNQLDPHFVALFTLDREQTQVLLQANGLIDVCIPRGGQALIDFVRQNATLPVIETGAGVVHLYFDGRGDASKGREIIHNAKTRRVSVCNALDCLLIHKNRLPDLYAIIEPLQFSRVEILADPDAYEALQSCYPSGLLFIAGEEAYGKEFLSYKMAIKTVDSIDAAIQHITRYTSGHSEAIVTEEEKNAEYFSQRIDAAVVYVNASTAFTDGGQFGMGSEIGISTQKLHARGPMGLDALTSYQWRVYGNGHVR